MILTKVIVNTSSEASDLVSNILINNGSNGSTIVDKKEIESFLKANSALNYESSLIEFYPEQVMVVGVLSGKDPQIDLTNIKSELQKLSKRCPFNAGELSVRVEKINDQHWVDIWMDYYKPFSVGKLKIYASWQNVKRDLFKTAVVLNPGPAFGTGQHPTTELVLKTMQEIPLKGKTVLDIGCGSGILGISAVKLGAQKAHLIDIDDVAIESSKENSDINKVSDKVVIENKDLIYTPNTDIVGDVALINITSEVLIDYAPNLKNNLIKNGYAILSGILPEDCAKVEKAYLDNGYTVVKKYEKENWDTILIVRKN